MSQATINEDAVNAIELWLARALPDQYRRLSPQELTSQYVGRGFVRGWRLTQAAGQVVAGIRSADLLVDSEWPYSALRVALPDAPGPLIWPHVESDGVLCLSRGFPTDIGSRISEALAEASEIVDMRHSGEGEDEFRNEWASYWFNSNSESTTKTLSLLRPEGPTRQVKCISLDSTFLVAEDSETLLAHVMRRGISDAQKRISDALFVWLDRPLIPSEFPRNANDLRELLERHNIEDPTAPVLSAGVVVLGAITNAGPSLVAVRCPSGNKKDLEKGFRPGHVPSTVLAQRLGPLRVDRHTVSRLDPAWLHGRGKDDSAVDLRQRRVAIVGVGAIGGELASLLARAGVGSFVLVDSDKMEASNAYRHLLGLGYLGQPKVRAMKQRLLSDLAYTVEVVDYLGNISTALDRQPALLDNIDLIITAGLPRGADIVIERWRLTTGKATPQLMVWVEPYAVVAHAALAVGDAHAACIFDDTGKVRFRITDWPASTFEIREPGCGTFFQPYSGLDISRAANLGARVALDVLRGKQTGATRWVQIGDTSVVSEKGGSINDTTHGAWSLAEYVYAPCGECESCKARDANQKSLAMSGPASPNQAWSWIKRLLRIG